MTGETDPPNITEPPTVPPVTTPPVTPPATGEGDVDAKIAAIEASVGEVTDVVSGLTEKLEAVLNPKTTDPTDPPKDPPSTNPEVLKLQGELGLLKTAFEQDAAAKLADLTARKTELTDSIVANNPAYAAQKESLANMDETFLMMLAEQSKPAEPRTRVAGGTKYTSENFQTQAERLRTERRNNSIR